MRRPTRTKAIGAGQELRLVDGFQHHHHCPLRDLVLERWDPNRTSPTIRLGDVHAPHWWRPVCSGAELRGKPMKVSLQVAREVCGGLPVHSGGTILAGSAVRFSYPFEVDHVRDAGEGLLPVLPRQL